MALNWSIRYKLSFLVFLTIYVKLVINKALFLTREILKQIKIASNKDKTFLKCDILNSISIEILILYLAKLILASNHLT